MAADVLVALPALRAAAAQAGDPTLRAMLPPQAFGDRADTQQTALDEVAGPAVAVASLTLARALAAAGVTPTHLAGPGSPLLPTPALTEALGGAAPATVTSGDATFDDEIRRLHADGVHTFVEVGPGNTLTTRVHATLGDKPHLAVSVDHPGTHGLTSLLDALARLAVAGTTVDIDILHTGRDSDPTRWDNPPRKPGWIVNGHCARTAAGDSLPKGLKPATETPPIHLAASAGGPPVLTVTGPPPDMAGLDLTAEDVAVVLEYLRIIDGMIASSNDIIQGALASRGRPGNGGNGTDGHRTALALVPRGAGPNGQAGR
jgi:hypothetical protein